MPTRVDGDLANLLVERLITKTETGGIEWRRTDDDDKFLGVTRDFVFTASCRGLEVAAAGEVPVSLRTARTEQLIELIERELRDTEAVIRRAIESLA